MTSQRRTPRLFLFALTVFAAAAAQAGQVYTSGNAAAGNQLLVYDDARDGHLRLIAELPTGGLGTGNGLGSQGAVTLSDDARHLFVVNAGSNTVSTFTMERGGPVLTSVVDSGGLRPVSVTERDGLVVVLNAEGNGNIAAFHLRHGVLQAIAGSSRPLSAASGVAPGQVGFNEDGDTVVVSEKNTNRLTTYAVRADGLLGQPQVTPSAGATPFGFAFDRRDHLIVSEAQGGAANASSASSYRLGPWPGARPVLVNGPVSTTQTAACWVAVTPNGRFAYTGNAGSDSISSFRIRHDGQIALAAAVAGSTGAGNGATDLAVSGNGHRLFALAPRGHVLVSYEVRGDGGLRTLDALPGLPTTAVGLAAD